MRITIDTELKRIIVPNSFFTTVDKMNEIIESAGGNKITNHSEFIKGIFNEAIEQPILRQSDVVSSRKKK